MSGKLHFDDTKEDFKFTGEDLQDLGEIGRGRFGVVNKMRHQQSQRIMAVKVRRFLISYLILINTIFVYLESKNNNNNV